MAFDIDTALRYVVEHEGSDLHLKVDAPPMARIHGELHPVEGAAPLTMEDTDAALTQIIGERPIREAFDTDGEADFSYSISDLSRFRVNAFRQRGWVSIVCRAIPYQVRTIDDLGLPEVIRTLAEEQRGIVLLTGTTGSGKSTTLAAMIDHINSNWPRHIVTLEDPIEYLHSDKTSIINQREVGLDTESFARAMRRVLRQDPDVILVGEMRDEETVRTALSAAETGHLVLSTLHTVDATETVNRIIDFFPPHLHQQARVMLAATLRGVVGQRLVQRAGDHGRGRVACCEVLVVTGRVQDLILNPTETGRITEVIAEGEYYGMQTFDQALLKQVMAGDVTEEVALDAASSPHDFKLMLQAQGQRASGIEQVTAADTEPAPVEPVPVAAEPPPPPVEPVPVAAEPPPAPVEPVPVAVEPPPAPVEPLPVAAEPPPPPLQPVPVAVEPVPVAAEPPPGAVEPAPVSVGPPPGAVEPELAETH